MKNVAHIEKNNPHVNFEKTISNVEILYIFETIYLNIEATSCDNGKSIKNTK